MSESDHEPSDSLLGLIFAALEVGIDTVRATNGGMHPFLMTPGDDKPSFIRFVGGSLESCIQMAQNAVAELGTEVPAYAIAIDGYATFDGEKTDAMIVEAGERQEPVAFVFAQRYRPAGDDQPFEVIGQPALLQEVPNRLSDSLAP